MKDKKLELKPLTAIEIDDLLKALPPIQPLNTLPIPEVGGQYPLTDLNFPTLPPESTSAVGAVGSNYNIYSIPDPAGQSGYNYNYATMNPNQTFSIDSTSNYLQINDNISFPKVNITQDGVHMEEDCDITIGDFSVKDSLERIEKTLGILRVNPELEKDWDELRLLGERYRELEKDIKDKIKVWDILKKN